MKEQLVSVITPMYNAGKTVRQTIESVLAQTYPDFEMLIVDDCSADDGAAVVMEYAAKDERIKLIRNEKNLGVAMTRNKAIEAAEGRYIAFLDSDDIWYPEKLEKQLELMRKDHSVFCFAACDVIDAEGKKSGKVRQVPAKVNYKRLLRGNCINCMTVVLDRKKLGRIRMKAVRHEDYDLWLEILSRGYTASGIEEALAAYRVAGESLSSNKLKAAKWHWDVLKRQKGIGLPKRCILFVQYLYQAVAKRV